MTNFAKGYQNAADEKSDELKGKDLIEGFRGLPPLNKKALVDTILRIGRFGMDAAGLYESVDFNPVLLTKDQAVVVDANGEVFCTSRLKSSVEFF